MNKKNIYIYIKAHPKSKFIFRNLMNIKKIDSFKTMNFDKIFISPTSTMQYDFDILKKKYTKFNVGYKFL